MYTIEQMYDHPVFKKIHDLSKEHDFKFDSSIESLTAGQNWEISLENWDQYFFGNLFKKIENVDLLLDPIGKARTNFEQFILDQNEYVQHMTYFINGLGTDEKNAELNSILIETRKFLTRALSDVKITDIIPRHSNGATLNCPKGSSIIDKIKDSGGIKHLLSNADRNSQYGVELFWALQKVPYLSGDDDFHIRVNVVPKNAKIGRVIGVGPTMVIAVQNGFGDLIGKSLKKYCDIDMSIAQDQHKEIVIGASLGDEFSTLDLEGGSNNIWRPLAYFLLRNRPDLVWLMDVISPSSFDFVDDENGTTRRVASSMLALQGNGFIMNFQTLFYYSLIYGLQKVLRRKGMISDLHPIKVFGDDIIVHRSVAEKVVNLFNFLKLTINVDKSFINPPFFESCGMDAIYGINVRPYYVHDLPAKAEHWYRFVNGIRRVCYYNNANCWRSDATYNFWKWCVRSIPKEQRLYGPRILGDAVINIEASYLYKFGKPERGDREYLQRQGDGKSYPGEGRDSNGFPYTSERVKARVVRETNFENSFGTSIKGVPADVAMSIAIDPSLKGKGYRLLKKEGVWQAAYPYSFNSNGEKVQNQFVPYAPWGVAPENVDELFDFLKSRGNDIITDSDHIVSVYNKKLMNKRRELISVLSQIRKKMEDNIRVAKNLQFEL